MRTAPGTRNLPPRGGGPRTPDPAADRRRGILWALASAVGGAFMVIPWKLANEAGDPADAVLLLLGVAALGSTGLVVVQRIVSGGITLRVRRIDWAVAALLATFTLAGNQLSAWAIRELSPALMNVLLRADVLIVAVFGWLLLGERVRGRFWVGAAVAVYGLSVLQGPATEVTPGELLRSGTVLALGAAACFSALALVTRAFIERIDVSAVNMLRLWLAVALWLPFNGLPRPAEIPGEQALYATLAAVAGPFLGRLTLMIAARYVEARLSTLVTLTTPVLTLVLGFVLLADWPEEHELAGGALMIAGIAIPLLRWPGGSSRSRAGVAEDVAPDG